MPNNNDVDALQGISNILTAIAACNSETDQALIRLLQVVSLSFTALQGSSKNLNCIEPQQALLKILTAHKAHPAVVGLREALRQEKNNWPENPNPIDGVMACVEVLECLDTQFGKLYPNLIERYKAAFLKCPNKALAFLEILNSVECIKDIGVIRLLFNNIEKIEPLWQILNSILIAKRRSDSETLLAPTSVFLAQKDPSYIFESMLSHDEDDLGRINKVLQVLGPVCLAGLDVEVIVQRLSYTVGEN